MAFGNAVPPPLTKNKARRIAASITLNGELGEVRETCNTALL